MNLEKFQILHRLTGFLVILFIVFFAVTGIFLNHSDQLRMDKKQVDFNWLLDLYSITPPQPPVSFTTGNIWVTRIDTRLYFNDQELPERTDALLGIVGIDGVVIAALSDTLLLLTENGEIIEKITPVNGLPAGLQKIGKLDDDMFIIAAADGYYSNHAELGDWQEIQATAINWSVPGPLPEASLQRVMSLYRGSGLTLERILMDLHSGRLLGRWKIIIVDLVSILLILSAVSGVSMWYKKRKMMAGIK